jgi:hypothetical protein
VQEQLGLFAVHQLLRVLLYGGVAVAVMWQCAVLRLVVLADSCLQPVMLKKLPFVQLKIERWYKD